MPDDGSLFLFVLFKYINPIVLRIYIYYNTLWFNLHINLEFLFLFLSPSCPRYASVYLILFLLFSIKY